jgi:hypothetical protein
MITCRVIYSNDLWVLALELTLKNNDISSVVI